MGGSSSKNKAAGKRKKSSLVRKLSMGSARRPRKSTLASVSDQVVDIYKSEPESMVWSHGSDTVAGEDEDDKSLLKRFLATHPLFQHLNKQGVKSAISLLDLVRYDAGDEVVSKDDDTANNFFIVVSGSIEIAEDDGHSHERRRQVLAAHESFGEAGFHYGLTGSYAATAWDDTCLLQLSRKVYDSNKAKAWLRKVDAHIVTTALVFATQRLQRVQFLVALPAEQLVEVARLFSARALHKGERLFAEGDAADSFYVLVSGELVLTLDGSGGFDMLEIKRLADGASFGENSLVDAQPVCATTATAMRSSIVLRLRRADFNRLQAPSAALHADIAGSIRDKSAVTLLSHKFKFGEFLDKHRLLLLASIAVPAFYAPDTVIFEQGSVNPKMFFIVASGSVDVLVEDERVSALEAGEYFGELSIVSGKPHSATIVANGNGARCFMITKDEFTNLFRSEAAVYAEVQIKVLGRAAELRHILHHPAGRKALQEHMVKERASESISFWLAAEEMERLGEQQVSKAVLDAFDVSPEEVVKKRLDDLVTRTRQIFNWFIDPRGPKAINIEGSLRTAIQEAIETQAFSYTIFNDAKDAVYALMEEDNFARFKESDVFEDVLAHIGVYHNDALTSERALSSFTTKTDKVARRDKVAQLARKKAARNKQATFNRKNIQALKDQILE